MLQYIPSHKIECHYVTVRHIVLNWTALGLHCITCWKCTCDMPPESVLCKIKYLASTPKNHQFEVAVHVWVFVSDFWRTFRTGSPAYRATQCSNRSSVLQVEVLRSETHNVLIPFNKLIVATVAGNHGLCIKLLKHIQKDIYCSWSIFQPRIMKKKQPRQGPLN